MTQRAEASVNLPATAGAVIDERPALSQAASQGQPQGPSQGGLAETALADSRRETLSFEPGSSDATTDPDLTDEGSIETDWTHEHFETEESKSLLALIPYTIRSLAELRNVKFALASFVVNNLRRRYRRSVLGFAWSLLNPLVTMTVMTAVFSLLWHADPRMFGVYVFTGLLPWTFITDSITNGSLSLVQSEAFLKKVYIPKAFFPLVYVSTEAANFSFSLVSLIILAAITGLHVHATVLLVPAATLILFLFNFSITLFLAIATVYFRDLSHIIKVGLSTLFYTVPVVYQLDMVPAQYRSYFLLNPMYHFVQLFRALILDGRLPTAWEWSIPALIALAFAAVAFYTLMRTERDLIYRL